MAVEWRDKFMRKYILIVFAALCCLLSCNKNARPAEDPQLVVNFTNTSGDWVLESWKGQPMDRTPVYIHLKAKEFVMMSSVGSMYLHKTTGSYNLYEVEGVGMVIRGIYDFTYDYWSHEYVISSLTAKKMVWTSMDDPEDVHIYARTDKFPAE